MSNKKAPGVDGFLSTPFTIQELMLAIRQLKSGKAQGPDNIQSFLSTVAQDVWNVRSSGDFTPTVSQTWPNP